MEQRSTLRAPRGSQCPGEKGCFCQIWNDFSMNSESGDTLGATSLFGLIKDKEAEKQYTLLL